MRRGMNPPSSIVWTYLALHTRGHEQEEGEVGDRKKSRVQELVQEKGVEPSRSIGGYFLAGVSIFGVVFATPQYHISQQGADLAVLVLGIGVLAGMLLVGRTADVLLRRGHLNSRIWLGMLGYLLATLPLLPAFLTHSLAIALPLFTLGAFFLAGCRATTRRRTRPCDRAAPAWPCRGDPPSAADGGGGRRAGDASLTPRHLMDCAHAAIRTAPPSAWLLHWEHTLNRFLTYTQV
jgi:hypothetical protein